MYTLTLSWTAYYINNTNCLKHNIDDSDVNISIALFAYILLILFYLVLNLFHCIVNYGNLRFIIELTMQ